jgi:predicted homoserine dehydrogenase-like protein
MPAARSTAVGACPIGLAQDVALVRAVKAGEVIRLADLRLREDDPVLALRREMVPG